MKDFIFNLLLGGFATLIGFYICFKAYEKNLVQNLEAHGHVHVGEYLLINSEDF